MTQPGTPLAIDINCADSPEVQAQKAVLAVRRVRGEWSYIKPVTVQARVASPSAPAAISAPQAREPDRAATAGQKEAVEKEVNHRAIPATQREGLNEALNSGVEALDAKRYQEAIAAFTKASESDPKQGIVWANLGAAYVGLAGITMGAESTAALRKGMEAYATAITLKSEDAVIHNNYARALARAGMFKEMDAEARRAADLDPSNAWRVFYNLGTLLTNTGQNDAAGKAFQRAIEAAPEDPGNAESYYRYGLSLVGKAQVGAGGKIVPVAGTVESLRKYLQLAPTGAKAQAAKEMLTSLGSSVETRFTDPGAKKKK
jgi:tetratricopeptide (TPR) repeat protein